MSIKLNPLIYSGLDIAGSGSSLAIGAIISGSTAHSILKVDAANALAEIGPLTNGQLIIGSTGLAPVATTLTGTINQLTVTNGAGSITLSLPQDIATTSNVTFASVTTTYIDGATLALGTSTASIVNIGNSSSVVNFNGTVNNNNVTNLNVTDKLFTVNKGGGAASATDSGFEIEENSLITGYFKTNGTRDGFLFKAPASQQAQLDLTLLTASRSFQVPDVSGIVGLVPTSGVVKSNGSVLSSSAVSLTTEVSGVLPIANGGTNSSTALNNTRLMISSGGSIVEHSTLTASAPMRTDISGLPTTGATSLTSEVSGILPIANGGTALSTVPTNGQLLIGNGTNYTLAGLTGTTNQVSVTNGSGSITLSLPQDIHSGASPSFTGLTLSGVSTGVVKSTLGVLSSSAVSLTSEISGVLPIANGGTNSSTALNNSRIMITSAGAIVEHSALTASAPMRTDGSGLPTTGATSLTSEVSGTLPVANGGTNSSTALNNNRIMVSSGGAIVEAGALTDGQLLIGSTGNAPSAATISAGSGVTVTNGAGSITVSSSTFVSGDLAQTTFTSATDVVAGGTITGFAFSNASVRSFRAIVSVLIDATTDLFASYDILGIQESASWEITVSSIGTVGGVLSFSIDNTGQMLYSKTTTAGHTLTTIKFRAEVLSV